MADNSFLPTRRIFIQRTFFILSLTFLYAFAYLALYPYVGEVAVAISILPIFPIAWYFTWKAGIRAVVAISLANVLLFQFVGRHAHIEIVTGAVILSITALFIGWVRKQQTNLTDTRRALYEANMALETKVAKRTSELQKSQQQLQHDAFHDTLTGLPNRSLFVDRLGQVLQRQKRNRTFNFAVFFLDIDQFKLVNDSLGHNMGDELLMQIAQRLKVCLRSIDTVARLGGDEFVILLEDVGDPEDISDTIHVANRVLSEISRPFRLGDHEVFTSTSIGISFGSIGYSNPEDILRDADIAMYRAKDMGKARYEIFDQSMHVLAVRRMQMEMDLRKAIERREFLVHYQPFISLETGKISGFEALVRWQHPTRGVVPPGDFIPLAEDTGLIIPIGLFVLKEACRQMKLWHELFPNHEALTISVNLSPKQFSQPDLVYQINRILEDTHLDPKCLELEITESAIIESQEVAANILEQLIERGIQLHMDDFGTGYSSLSYLHRFPFHSLKIDRSFVSKINGGNENVEIVQAIVGLAKSLGLKIVAEGVETERQLDCLKSMACNMGQGFLFSKPIEAGPAAELIQAQSDGWLYTQNGYSNKDKQLILQS
ncbi:MAG: EAL domain-containing protein [Chloroflexi bacterium]|nr:MAG: EAL domain-containing protein [Chloroflexota bacterium]MBL1193317.1 EAL domain-containing protein [Chloroflexota bacterium]NOH10609.1 EAL domain-containing protein [Chloroflexota bacterium]